MSVAQQLDDADSIEITIKVQKSCSEPHTALWFDIFFWIYNRFFFFITSRATHYITLLPKIEEVAFIFDFFVAVCWQCRTSF